MHTEPRTHTPAPSCTSDMCAHELTQGRGRVFACIACTWRTGDVCMSARTSYSYSASLVRKCSWKGFLLSGLERNVSGDSAERRSRNARGETLAPPCVKTSSPPPSAALLFLAPRSAQRSITERCGFRVPRLIAGIPAKGGRDGTAIARVTPEFLDEENLERRRRAWTGPSPFVTFYKSVPLFLSRLSVAFRDAHLRANTTRKENCTH